MASFAAPEQWTDQPGTIDDLLADAHERGFPATARLVYDWVGLGLLDHPERRSRGAEGGSDKALWPWTQRNLFRLLVEKRPQVKGLAPLCNIPVAIWLWWGEAYVPTTQVQRALATWASKVSGYPWHAARRQAREVAEFIDDLGVPKHYKERMVEALASVGYNGQLDKDALVDVLRGVLDPYGEGRAIGSSLMPVTPESFADLVQSRVTGLQLARKPASTEDLALAWQYCRWGIESYAANYQALVGGSIRPQDAQMWEQPSWDLLVNRACAQVVLALGGLAWRGSPARPQR